MRSHIINVRDPGFVLPCRYLGSHPRPLRGTTSSRLAWGKSLGQQVQVNGRIYRARLVEDLAGRTESWASLSIIPKKIIYTPAMEAAVHITVTYATYRALLSTSLMVIDPQAVPVFLSP